MAASTVMAIQRAKIQNTSPTSNRFFFARSLLPVSAGIESAAVGILLTGNPWVDEGEETVNDEVDEDDHHCDKQRDALHRKVVDLLN